MTTADPLHASAFILLIRPGQVEEYKRRHAEIWPEMRAALRKYSLVHYSIYLLKDERQVLIHVLRRGSPHDGAPEEPVILRWRAYMADVLEMDGDRPRRVPLEAVFQLDGTG